jgi:trans-2,3-dihydro-3-hydroxyanthranilate isomerase
MHSSVAAPGARRRAVPIARVDAFAAHPFGGNPAVVVLEAGSLVEDELSRIAAELRAPGTAFVFPADAPGIDRRLRVFTPAREVSYSGHTTLAAAHALLEAGVGDRRLVLATGAGPVVIDVEREGGRTLVWQSPPLPRCEPADVELAPLLEALGLAPHEVDTRPRPSLTPERDLLVPVRSLAALRALAPDTTVLGARATVARLRGLALVSRETLEPASTTHTRFFAPHVGIAEDIVTGSAHAAIGVWLADAAALAGGEGPVRFLGEQGDGLGRPSRILVEVTRDGARPTRVRIGGTAVTILTGTLRLP